MDNNYRVAVIESLKKIFRDKSYSNLVINNDIKNIDVKYNSIYRKSVLGVVENLMLIDWVINQMSKTKTKKMESEVLFTLRLAVYQLYFLDNSFENIVVNESVEHIKRNVNVRASKFVNAVLRNIIRNKDNIIRDMNKLSHIDFLSVKYSYPKWLVSRWIGEFGKDKIEDVLVANNSQAPFTIRVNTLKVSRGELIRILERKGMIVEECKYLDKGIIIENPVEIDKMNEYKSGLFSIQSESSMLAGQVLNPKENSLVIDLCAAPGGKSLNAAEMMKNKGKIISRDVYENKISLIEYDKKRLGVENIFVETYDATVLDRKLINRADYCIVDVPCTGLGIIRRKPEIKYNKLESDLESIQKIQFKILENASKYLKLGGELVYSTCTVNKEENINMINNFLKSNSNFIMVDISEQTKNSFETSQKGYVEIFPHLHRMDGFFIAKLKRL
ncbi:16S rRNA (cytosine967-C5)-methyltransferase [Sedimentibacter acidaminivorans]|uniref:16S rRNA (cytosine(967)-C(5))-methyltransferase n=1 Tax=Sedimentibacter acidaminivorans TaxID=913099 RepID=A0ABS4GB16_9FIRM|nr:16S rRNA (cytosine(967)-C(5))-methyltransferase RsmB [Sedimentibacter acidaminivorans]MBP1924874.1 16S rRNA (cytosine967-C5)-methyltransferase [Sedimentibacter acidaminivorans]